MNLMVRHFTDRNPEFLRAPINQATVNRMYYPGAIFWMNDGRRYTYGQAVADIPAGSSVTRQWVTANEWDVTMSNRNIVYGKNSNEFRDQMFQFGQAVVNGQACSISGNKYHPKYSSTRIDLFEDIYTLDPPISGSAGHNLMNTYSSRFRGFKPGVATTMQSYSLCPVKSGYWAWFQDRGLCNNNGTIKWVGPKY